VDSLYAQRIDLAGFIYIIIVDMHVTEFVLSIFIFSMTLMSIFI
jgi:hypothetical protein